MWVDFIDINEGMCTSRFSDVASKVHLIDIFFCVDSAAEASGGVEARLPHLEPVMLFDIYILYIFVFHVFFSDFRVRPL